MGLIYCATNKVNGKKYIGQTRNLIEDRIKQHVYGAESGRVTGKFQNALLKYGSDNFSWGVLDYCDNNNLNEKEIYYIKKYDTFEKGYNSTIGGDNFQETNIKYEGSKIKELIKDIIETDISYKDLSNKYNIHYSTVCKIAAKKVREDCWEGKDNPREKIGREVYGDDEVRKIITLILENKKREEIITETGCTEYIINYIRLGMSHRDKWDDFKTYWKKREDYEVNIFGGGVKEDKAKYGDEVYLKIKDKVVNTKDSYTKIAEDLGIDRSLVYRFSAGTLRKDLWGGDKNPRRSWRRKYTKEDYEKVFKMYYIECKSMHKIQHESVKMSLSTIGYFLTYKRRQGWFDDFKEKYKEVIVRKMEYK